VQSPLGPIVLLQRSHPLFPPALFDLRDAPDQLAYVGLLSELTPAVSIVGTRQCDEPGRRFAFRLAFEVAQAGCLVVSGGAFGIDTAAHEGALAAGGRTIAVLPSGLEDPYPVTNRRLFERIVERGAVIAEQGERARAYPSTFLARNRIIAALGQSCVVVQAPNGSGAMSTAKHAKALNRPILGVPHAPWDTRGQGCLSLLLQGARICRTSQDVLTLAAPRAAASRPKNIRRPKKAEELQGLDEDQTAIVRALCKAPLDADELCEHSGLPAPRVQRALLMLLLSKVIQEVGSGRYERADYP
jgi:DNA processing protein